MRLIKWGMRLALSGAVGIVILLGLLWLDHRRQTSLPLPTGTFAVGRTTFVWSDDTQPALLASQPDAKRQVFAWIWYPAAPQSSSEKAAEYLPEPWCRALEHRGGVLLTQFLTRDLARVRTHSVPNAPLSPRRRSYPVVVMRAGLAALTASYTSLAEDLASHGYVVVGFDAPYRTTLVVFPDGRVVQRLPQNNADLVGGAEQERLALRLAKAWSADIGFVLDRMAQLNASDRVDRFRGRLDLEHVGVFGHSLGGAEALQFCHDDRRCKAGIDVDGAPLGQVISDGVPQPFLFIEGDHTDEPDAARVEANIRAIYNRLPAGKKLWIAIRGANHFGFSDDGAMLKSPAAMDVMRWLGIVHLDGRRQIAITTNFVSAFFDVYLQGAPAKTLRSRPSYREVEIVH